MLKELQPERERLERTGLSLKRQEDFGGGEIFGMAFFDLDGTLTTPGSKYALDKRTLSSVSEFIFRGGICVLNTGATKERSERTFMNPIFCLLDEMSGFDEASKIFADRVWLLPENGSAILKSKEVAIVENELWFNWDEQDTCHVPCKKELRQLIEQKLIPKVFGSFIIGDQPGEIGRRNYILSWKGLKSVPELIKMIKDEIIPITPEIDWSNIEMKAARTTIDFINARSGKELSTKKLLEMLKFSGPIIGFGDLGDEFGKVPGVLTFNVNTEKPNSFRMARVPSLELTNWVTVDSDKCSLSSKGEVFFNGEKVEVLRDRNGNIIWSKIDNDGHTIPDISGNQKDKLIVSTPLTRGAGEATAEMLERLMEVGYFDKQ